MTREPGTPCGGGCGRGFGGLTPNDWFRCFHCRKPFCPECALGHFGDRDELQARLDRAEFKYAALVAQIRDHVPFVCQRGDDALAAVKATTRLVQQYHAENMARKDWIDKLEAKLQGLEI